MKISRRRKHNKRSKHTKRSKYTRHTKHGGGKHYKNKRTYRKHPRKLKHKIRLQRGGVKTKINNFMKVSTDLGIIVYFFEDDNDANTVYDSSDKHEGDANYRLDLTYTKDRRDGVLGFFKSKTKEFPNKRFDWRITLLSIREILELEGEILKYRYTYKIQLCCRLKDSRYITFDTYAYADTIDNRRGFKNEILDRWGNYSIHVVNEDASDHSNPYESLEKGLVLKGTISQTCYDVVESLTDDNIRIYTFPYMQNITTFEKIVNIFYQLKMKADLKVLSYLGKTSFAMRDKIETRDDHSRLQRQNTVLSSGIPVLSSGVPRFLSIPSSSRQ